MIAWDKTATKVKVLPDDIWTIGELMKASSGMAQDAKPHRSNATIRTPGRAAAIRAISDGRQTDGDVQGKIATVGADVKLLPGSHRLMRTIIGNSGAAVTAALCLPAAGVIMGGLPVAVIGEGIIGILSLRLLITLIQTANLSHEHGLIRLSTRKMLRDEVLFSLAFCTTAFLLGWSLTPILATVFLSLNIAVQAMVHWAGRVMLRSGSIDKTSVRDCRAIIVGTGIRAKRVVDALLDHPELDMAPCGFLDADRAGLWRYRDVPLLGRPEDLEQLVLSGQVDALFVTTEPYEVSVSQRLLDLAHKMGVTVHVVPGHAGISSTVEIARLNGFPTLVYRATPYRYTAMALKRAADVVGAIALLLVSLPVMTAAAVAVKMGSRGPVLFRQVRSGRNGRRFMLYKFRTMTCDAEQKKASLWNQNEMSGPVFKIRNDPRITPIGRFLRKYSVDELPQLWNVLAGDMSLVGPRPPLPSEVRRFEPWQRRKLSVRPGLTCLWQVNGRNAIDFNDWMRLDLDYIDGWSLTLDAKILVRTIPTVLKGSGV